jgi:hypothetical protein
MAKKLRQDPISKNDLTRFLNTESDFAFELSVIPLLRDSGWNVEHGGTYSDPVTGVNRQFARNRRATKCSLCRTRKVASMS